MLILHDLHWYYHQKFGESIAYAQNGNLLIGAPGDNTGADEAGSAYLFDAIVDADNDGIHDYIDDDEDYFNDSFDDGITDGVIVTRGDQILKIIDEPGSFGVRIITDAAGGPTPAEISICGGASQAFFASENEVIGTCGSVTWEVLVGEINGVVVTVDGQTAEFSLKSGDNFYYDNNSFSLQSSEGSSEITLVGNDGSEIIVILSDGSSISFDAETSIITADSSNTNDVIVIIGGKEIIIEPGKTSVSSSAQSIEDVIDELVNLKSEIQNKQSIKKLDKAINHLQDSLNENFWIDEEHLDSKKGHKVFNEEKKAVKSLLKIQKKDPSVDVSEIIDAIVEVDRQLAENAIDQANAFAGEKKADKHIEKASEAMDKAIEKLNDDKPNKAIDQYKKAWKHAQIAMKFDVDENEDEENEDDEDEDDEDDDEIDD